MRILRITCAVMRILRITCAVMALRFVSQCVFALSVPQEEESFHNLKGKPQNLGQF